MCSSDLGVRFGYLGEARESSPDDEAEYACDGEGQEGSLEPVAPPDLSNREQGKHRHADGGAPDARLVDDLAYQTGFRVRRARDAILLRHIN